MNEIYKRVRETGNPRQLEGRTRPHSLSHTPQSITPGRIRTSDRRIRNPLAVVRNRELSKDLSQMVDSGCTNGCTPKPENVISDPNLIRLIELWPSLPIIERFTVIEFVEKQVAAIRGSGT